MTARIEQLTSPADLALLGPLWLSLHHHHQAVSRSSYAELETLSVRDHARSAGIGMLLLDRLDKVLAERGIVDMVVSVLVDNSEALRFYRRRGLVPVETCLWRIGARRVLGAGAAVSR